MVGLAHGCLNSHGAWIPQHSNSAGRIHRQKSLQGFRLSIEVAPAATKSTTVAGCFPFHKVHARSLGLSQC